MQLSALEKDKPALAALDRELEVYKASTAKLRANAEQIETFIKAISVLAAQMRETVETEPVLADLNRRDVAGVIIRSYTKDIRPWIVESLQWALDMATPSTFKVFQAGRPFAEVLRKDLVRVEQQAEFVKARIIRGG